MILTKEQINRYLRQIIIPEISGAGQKKALESSVIIYAEDVNSISTLVYYLAASGIGRIICSLNNSLDYNHLFDNVRDLSADVEIELIKKNSDITNMNIDCVIILGKSNQIGQLNKSSISKINPPVILGLITPWKGLVVTSKDFEEVNTRCSLTEAADAYNLLNNNLSEIGYLLSECFIGAVSAAECFMQCIGIQNTNKNLYYDLFHNQYEYFQHEYSLKTYLGKLFLANKNYPRIKETKNVLSASKALVVGTGGLGCPSAYALARAGVGTIGIMDYDKVEISNLNRQILHATSRIGMPKVKSAEHFFIRNSINTDLILYEERLSSENALDIIKDYDMVIDGLDNLPTRYMLNDACYFAGKPMIEAGVITFMGLATFIHSKESACYRCLFPQSDDDSKAQSCAEAGILGSVPGIMGFIQASEAIKYLIKSGNLLKNKVLYYDIENSEIMMIDMNKIDDCSLCGSNPSIKNIKDYDFECDINRH